MLTFDSQASDARQHRPHRLIKSYAENMIAIMQKLLAVLVLLFGCLAVAGQAVASSWAGYSDCCLQGCKGMVHCTNDACQACAASQAAPMQEALVRRIVSGMPWFSCNSTLDSGSPRRPWTPPD